MDSRISNILIHEIKEQNTYYCDGNIYVNLRMRAMCLVPSNNMIYPYSKCSYTFPVQTYTPQKLNVIGTDKTLGRTDILTFIFMNK